MCLEDNISVIKGPTCFVGLLAVKLGHSSIPSSSLDFFVIFGWAGLKIYPSKFTTSSARSLFRD